MSALGRFWLGPSGSETLFHPDGFAITEEDFEINREGRVANGDLKIDVIASKKRFTITYQTAVGQYALDELAGLYTSGITQMLSLIVERADSSTSTYTVKFRPFSRVSMARKNDWLWNPLEFTLEEV